MISDLIKKMVVDYPGYAYGSLVAMGGIMGYVKRQVGERGLASCSDFSRPWLQPN